MLIVFFEIRLENLNRVYRADWVSRLGHSILYDLTDQS